MITIRGKKERTERERRVTYAENPRWHYSAKLCFGQGSFVARGKVIFYVFRRARSLSRKMECPIYPPKYTRILPVDAVSIYFDVGPQKGDEA